MRSELDVSVHAFERAHGKSVAVRSCGTGSTANVSAVLDATAVHRDVFNRWRRSCLATSNGQRQGGRQRSSARGTFEEAVTALADPRAIEAPDLLRPARHVAIGMSAVFRLIFVVHLETVGDRTRIISARRANVAQRREYDEA